VYLSFQDTQTPNPEPKTRNPKLRTYLLATFLFILALLTKSVTATLPAALLVVVWWHRGRLSWRGDVLPLLPWFVAGIAAGLFTVYFERTGIGAQGVDFDLSLVERVLLAGRVVWFYLGKLLWPADLAFFYPRWEIDATSVAQWLFPLATALVLAAAVLVAANTSEPFRRFSPHTRRAPLAALLLFGGTLFPVLGFVNVYPFIFSYVADHFQYLASLPVFAVIGSVATSVSEWLQTPPSQPKTQNPKLKTYFAAGALLLTLGALTFAQARHYRDSITLYRATLANNPHSWVAHHNLGSELTARGALDEALPHARRAVELKPDFPEALNNLADNLTHTGRAAEALPLLERALQLQPRYAQAENNLGIALVTLGRAEEGIRHFQRAILLQPGLAEAHHNLGLAEAERGNFAAAIPHFAETVRLRPDHAGAELHWGVALAVSNRLPEARSHFERAISLEPASAASRQIYGRVVLNAGEVEAAVQLFREALRLDPELPGLHRDLAIALRRLGRLDEAQYHAIEADRRR
jgi:Flp pilus assembly protein TadD